jgi:hypothetical protein
MEEKGVALQACWPPIPLPYEPISSPGKCAARVLECSHNECVRVLRVCVCVCRWWWADGGMVARVTVRQAYALTYRTCTYLRLCMHTAIAAGL